MGALKMEEMSFIGYSLASLICFGGLILGIILANITKEELKEGRKYFMGLQNIFFALIIFFLLYFNTNIYLAVVVSFTVLVLLIFLKQPKMSYMAYPLMAIVFYLSSKSTETFIIESSLIFLYGFPTGSLLIDFKKKNHLKIIVNHLIFIVIAIALFMT
jgi:hypothetical protein